MGLSDIFQDIANAIRSKTGKADSIYPVDMASEIEGISSGGGYKLEKMPSGAVSSFNDGTDLPLNKLKVSIEPVQDLHGYDNPWAGGAGKNKLKYPYYASSTTLNGVTFTVNDDGTVKVNGTATADASFYLAYTGSDMVLPQGKYTLNGCPSGGSNATYMLNITNVSTQDIGSGANFTSDGTISLNIRIIVRANTTVSNLLFKPMIRLASVTDATFAPYSNICPISGWDEVNVTVANDVDNPTISNVYTLDLDGTRYGGTLDVVSGVLTVTNANIVSYNGEIINEPWISSMDVYSAGATPTTGAQVVYPLATPQTIQLAPTAVRSLIELNNIWADTGDIINGEYFKEAGIGSGTQNPD